jgi:hypothetical protein
VLHDRPLSKQDIDQLLREFPPRVNESSADWQERVRSKVELPTAGRRCEWCGVAIAGRTDRHTCSTRCRVALHRNGGVGRFPPEA